MSGRFIKILMTFSVLAIGLGAQAITFKEALQKCKGQTTPQCQKVRAMYRRLKEAQNKKAISKAPQALPVAQQIQEGVEEAKPEPKWDERGEIKSPFGLGYFAEIAGIGKSNDDGTSALGAYFHLDGGYKTRWGATIYARTPFLLDFSTADGEETLTALDPFFGIKGTVWSKGKWSFSNRLRLIMPLSQSSVDKGVTFSWGIDSKIVYSGKGYSAYLQLQPRGQFFGFGEEDRNNGSMSVELGIEEVAVSEKSALYFYFASGFSRKIGPDLGALVFTDDSSVATVLWGYEFNKHLTVLPGIKYNVTTKDASLIVWMWGALF